MYCGDAQAAGMMGFGSLMENRPYQQLKNAIMSMGVLDEIKIWSSVQEKFQQFLIAE